MVTSRSLTSGIDIFPTIINLLDDESLENQFKLELDGISLFSEDSFFENRELVIDSPPITLPQRLKKFPNLLTKQRFFQ